MHAFEITFNDQSTCRVQADNLTETRKYAQGLITIRKLNMGEVIDLTRRGLAITDAKTGQVINSVAPAEGPRGGGGRLSSDEE